MTGTDVAHRLDTVDQLFARVMELEKAIRTVVTQRADDLCWMDVYAYLGKLVGSPTTPEELALLPVEVTDKRCQRYFRSLRGGCPYEKDLATERVKALEKENEGLRRDLRLAADRIAAQSELLTAKAARRSHGHSGER